MILVDESFAAFSSEPSLVPRLEAEPLPNVVILTSLSKTPGVPGVRLGYVYSCDEQFCAAIARRLPIWNLNSVAEHLLEIVLEHRTSFAESLRRTADDRRGLADDLREAACVEQV